ncbi:MAG: DUF3843 family protein [Bacteroidetes bacterium]|nr:DUF3843 family protein [Bacteroidota bacterium]
MASKFPSWLHSHVLDKWKATRFYERIGEYDLFYIDLAKGIFSTLSTSTLMPLIVPEASEHDLADFSVWIAAWYEDFINEAGLWKAFTDRHQAVSGRALPFWDLDDYDAEYLNWQDMAMLLWTWERKVKSKKFSDPMSAAIRLQATVLTAMLESTIDIAPASTDWDDFLQLKPTDGFKEMRGKLMWIGLKSYLYGQLDFVGRDAEIQQKLRKEAVGQSEPYLKNVGYDIKLEVLFNFVTQFGGERLPVMASRILRGEPEVLASVAACSEKVLGTFWLEGSDAECHYLKEKESGRTFRVVRESANLKAENGRIVQTSLIKWRGDFWIGGVSTQDFGIAPKSKPEASLPLTLGTDEEVAEILEMLEVEYQCFISKFGGPLKFCASRSEAEDALQEFYSELEAVLARKKGREPEEVNLPKLTDYPVNESIAIFYSKGSGILISADAGYVIDFLGREPQGPSEIKSAFMSLFLECNYPMVHTIAQNYSLTPLQIPGFQFEVAPNVPALCWFMNPSGAGAPKPNMGIAVNGE